MTPQTARSDTPLQAFDAPPAALNSTPQSTEAAFPAVASMPAWDGMEGIELVSAHSFFLGLVPPNTDLIKVNLPESTQALNQKTTFVGVRFAGQSVISNCAFVSNWEVQQKYGKQFLPDVPNDPCGPDQMNALKNRYNFGQKFNGFNKIDGNITPVKDTPDCDPAFYRYYGPPIDSQVGTLENSRRVFQFPVVLSNKTEVQARGTVFYRFLSPGSKADFIRLNPTRITGATVAEIDSMDMWGTVDSDCADPSQGGVDKPENAVRGHDPISAVQ